MNFYPRPPGGGRLFDDLLLPDGIEFLSTPSGWRATSKYKTSFFIKFISIHALRVEGDLPRRQHVPLLSEISIHALRVEGDEHGCKITVVVGEFLSTPSGWRATYVFFAEDKAAAEFLSTPSGWRATNKKTTDTQTGSISIHALRVEGDNRYLCIKNHS